MIENPILKGFNPDPSIVRVGEDYYIATSTFEWFPGVQIYHSKDLKNWKLITRPLNRVSQLDMRGIPASGGIWAPCLTYHLGVFYLCYTVVLNHDGLFWNTHNYLVTTNEICGDWSEPVYLNSDGFDPSLFHDDDGRKWFVIRSLDYRSESRISMQKYCNKERKLIGERIYIFKSSPIGDAEGPHLYKINGFYYLIVAEGGTGYGHCVTVARSKYLTGPYEIDPKNPMLTARENIHCKLQKAGHADIVQTQNGDWYMVHLCGRPMPSLGVCILGRETSIQKVMWDNEGWLRIDRDGNEPCLDVIAPELMEHTWNKDMEKDNFDTDNLNINFQTLRMPLSEDCMSLKERPGYLRLRGRESLNSNFCQSLVARRQQSFKYSASTCVEFNPKTYKQMAGLVCYYSTHSFHYLHISHNEKIGKYISIMTCNNDEYSFPLKELIDTDNMERIYLKVIVDYNKLQFYYSQDGNEWLKVGKCLDASILSDEHILLKRWAFTGSFVGLCCQDLFDQSAFADFDYFEYIEEV